MKSLLQARYNLMVSRASCYPRNSKNEKMIPYTFSGSFREGEWAGKEVERHYSTGPDDDDHTYNFRDMRKSDRSPLVPPGMSVYL